MSIRGRDQHLQFPFSRSSKALCDSAKTRALTTFVWWHQKVSSKSQHVYTDCQVQPCLHFEVLGYFTFYQQTAGRAAIKKISRSVMCDRKNRWLLREPRVKYKIGNVITAYHIDYVLNGMYVMLCTYVGHCLPRTLRRCNKKK